ncbi:MAG: phosphoglucosamine mutase [Euryarchaeota archaeon]|nr:phosphoglucosamine mutase [Euryarchaeota archaeon]
MRLFGSSGIRGRFGTEITPELVLDVGRAVGTMHGSVVIGWDPRRTGHLLAQAACSGVLSTGSSSSLAGMIPTPTLAHAAGKFDAGIMITASHNPPEFNGVKLWNRDGMAFGTAQMTEVERILERRDFKVAQWEAVKPPGEVIGAARSHIDSIVKDIGAVNAKVVVDCGNGAASVVTPYLLREMGCKVTAINSHPDGSFPGRGSEPLQENLTHLRESVLALGADIGIAHDGDADRVVAFDEQGGFMDGDVLLPLLAKNSGSKNIVVPVDASMAIADYLKGVRITYSRVGDVYVAEKMKESKAEFGGEPSGTFIFSGHGFCPDGIFAAAVLCKLAGAGSLAEMVSGIPRYSMHRVRIACPAQKRDIVMKKLEASASSLSPKGMDRTDGLRLELGDGWCLVRASGTEPKIKIVVEARDESRAKAILQSAEKIVKEAIG